jgi:hypothetical protein
MTTNKEENNEVHVFRGEVIKMSAFQPIDIKPTFGRNWILNGDNGINFKTYKDAYDDSPTNASIINAFVNYIYGEGLIDTAEEPQDLSVYISEEDTLLMCQDYKIYGGYSGQVIWDDNDGDKKPLRIEYLPIYKLGVNYDFLTAVIDGYWYSWNWDKLYTYRPVMYPIFTGAYKGNDLELLVIRRPTAEAFFPVPDYLSGIPWAQVEGELGNAGKQHFKNAMSDITVINYNQGRQATAELAREEAAKVRAKVVGTDNQSSVIVSFNEGAEEAVVVDRISPPELNQQNVFYSEEAERKLIVAHSAPPILFQGSSAGSGFSSNADEIKVATNSLYRRNINPSRKVILNGFSSVFKLIDKAIKLDFADFEEEKLEEKKEEVKETVSEEQKFKFFKNLFK